jgi:hypothetical protein
MRIILPVLFLTVSLFAKDVLVDEKVQNFINDINATEDLYHRSGLANDKKDTLSSQARKSWNNSLQYNYKVIHSGGVVEKIKDELFSGNNLDNKNFIVKLFSNKSTLLVEKKSSPRPTDIMDEEYFSKENYIDMSKSYLPGINDLEGSVELENVAYETSKCDDCDDQFYRQERISGIYVRFRRIFEGGIVGGNISKILIKMDPDGSLRKLKIEWPEFQKINKEENSMSFENNISYVINELSTNENAHVVSNMTSLSINSYEINGAAKAWIPIRNDNEIIITPAVSYMLNVFLSDDSVVKKIVNYPLIPSIMENIKD